MLYKIIRCFCSSFCLQVMELIAFHGKHLSEKIFPDGPQALLQLTV
jgi:hypothetical protein